MKKCLLFCFGALLGLTSMAQESRMSSADGAVSVADTLRKERLQQHVYFLAADSLCGRSAGSADADKARAYLQAQYEAMGLEPWQECWEHPFEKRGKNFTNLVGVIPGCDPVLKNEYIVLGAHYDHLGVRNDTIVYNGADDNASGSAALVEIARELLAHRLELRRSILIAAFDAEELGLFGSSALAKELKEQGCDVRLMMSIDMVGWLKEGKQLTLEGTGTISHGEQLLSAAAQQFGLAIRCKNFESSIMTATDTEGFAQNGIPTLAVSTGLKSPYHKPEDDAELIDYEGMELVTRYLADVTASFASDTDFAPSGRVSFKHRAYPDHGMRFAVEAGFGSSGLTYPRQSAVDGQLAPGSFDVGLSGTYNMRPFAVQTDVLLGRQRYLVPDPDDCLAKSYSYSQTTLTIPVSLQLLFRTSDSVDMKLYFWIGGGAWYRHVFDDRFKDSSRKTASSDFLGAGTDIRSNDMGYHISFGVNIYNFAIEGCWMNGLTPLLTAPTLPTVKPWTRMCNLKWYF